MINDFIAFLVGVAENIIRMLPVADTTALVEFAAPAGRLIGWVLRLNEALPVVEMLTAVTLILSVYGALYVVMVVRRVFSLVWPGAGS